MENLQVGRDLSWDSIPMPLSGESSRASVAVAEEWEPSCSPEQREKTPWPLAPKPPRLESTAAQRAEAGTGSTPAAGVRFIHFTSQDGAQRSRNIRQVRSHVAKQIHAQRRRKHGDKDDKVSPTPVFPFRPPARSGSGSTAERGEEEGKGKGKGKMKGKEKASPIVDDDVIELGPGRYGESHERGRDMVNEGWLGLQTPSPDQRISNAWALDAGVGFAWPLSLKQYRLFGFYLEFVVHEGYKQCARTSQTELVKGMKTHVVPSCMNNSVFLSALLYVAANRLSMTSVNAGERQQFAIEAARYRVFCLAKLREALASGQTIDDWIIWLGLTMALEAFVEKDREGCLAHVSAVVDMVRARGGFENITLFSGFLRWLLLASLLDPKYDWVGKIEDGRAEGSEGSKGSTVAEKTDPKLLLFDRILKLM